MTWINKNLLFYGLWMTHWWKAEEKLWKVEENLWKVKDNLWIAKENLWEVKEYLGKTKGSPWKFKRMYGESERIYEKLKRILKYSRESVRSQIGLFVGCFWWGTTALQIVTIYMRWIDFIWSAIYKILCLTTKASLFLGRLLNLCQLLMCCRKSH